MERLPDFKSSGCCSHTFWGLFRSSLWLFWTTNLTSQLVCIVTVWLKWSIHNLQSIKHLLLLESKYANNKFTFYLRNSHSHMHLFELLCFKMLSIYYYDRKVNTNSCATSISGNVHETWFGQFARLWSTFCRYIYIYLRSYIYMVKLSKEQNNRQYNVLKIVKVTCKKTFFSQCCHFFLFSPVCGLASVCLFLSACIFTWLVRWCEWQELDESDKVLTKRKPGA